MIPQYISMFLLFCMLTNLLSIYAPVHVAAGSLKPANPKLITVLLHLVTFMIFFPLTQALTLIPLGTEMVLRALGYGAGLPICLLLSLARMRGGGRHLLFLFRRARKLAAIPRTTDPGNRDDQGDVRCDVRSSHFLMTNRSTSSPSAVS